MPGESGGGDWWSGLGRAELGELVGYMGQVCGVDTFEETQGPARGARRVRVATGAGLVYDVHPDRCLDLGAVSWRGLPLAWLAPAGFAAPAHFEAEPALR